MIKAYLDEVCSYIRCREVHAEVRLELESHIADLTEALVAAGVPAEEATAQALRQMGDPAQVGLGLHRAHRPRTDWQLIAAAAALVAVGLWAMYAGARSGSFPSQSLFAAQGVATGAGAVLAAGLYFFDYRRLRPYGWWLLGGALLTMPTPLSNPLWLVPGLAALFAGWGREDRRGGWKAAALALVPSILYFSANQALHTVVYLAMFALLFLMTRPRLHTLAPLGVAGLAGAALLARALITTPYRWERLRIFLSPFRDPRGMGYMVNRSIETLKGAGLWGHGPLARVELLPETHTDLIFPFLVHTLGWVAGGALCLLLLFFLVRLARLAGQSRDRFGYLLTAGFLAVFAVESVWNVAMTAGLAPMAGVGLPFVSFGRQQMLLQLGAVGLILSVFRRKDLGATTVH